MRAALAANSGEFGHILVLIVRCAHASLRKSMAPALDEATPDARREESTPENKEV
jgi:hypothetical protein